MTLKNTKKNDFSNLNFKKFGKIIEKKALSHEIQLNFHKFNKNKKKRARNLNKYFIQFVRFFVTYFIKKLKLNLKKKENAKMFMLETTVIKTTQKN